MATTERTAAQPRPPPSGLLLISVAILQDAAADLAQIQLRMTGADRDAAVMRDGVAAVAVLDRAGHLLQTQREVMLGQLTEMFLSAEKRETPWSTARLHPLTLTGRS